MSSTGVLNHCTFLKTLHLCKKQADVGVEFFAMDISDGYINDVLRIPLHFCNYPVFFLPLDKVSRSRTIQVWQNENSK